MLRRTLDSGLRRNDEDGRGQAASTMSLDVLRIETATLSSWPAITTAMDGMWLARMARGYTRRANSIQSLDPDDDDDAPRRLQRMVDLYLLNSREPIFRVTPLTGPRILATLDAEGWRSEGGTRVLAMTSLPALPQPENVQVYDATDQNWIDGFAELAGIDRRSRETLTLLVGLIAHRQAGILIRDTTGAPVAAALAVDAAGIGCFHNVVVRADRRGTGLGRGIMHAALNWTRSVGAVEAAIQVVSDNTLAVNLYTSLGFAEVYRYEYRRP
jgi:GNAT superfamily N-acetyltransferase